MHETGAEERETGQQVIIRHACKCGNVNAGGLAQARGGLLLSSSVLAVEGEESTLQDPQRDP